MTTLWELFAWFPVLLIELIGLPANTLEQNSPLEFTSNAMSISKGSAISKEGNAKPSLAMPNTSQREYQILEILKRAQEFYNQRKYKECLDVARPALGLFDDEKDLSNEKYGALLVMIGAALSEYGDWELALEFFSKALLVFQNTNEKRNMALTFFNIGRTNEYRNMRKPMLESYQRALELFREVDDINGQVTVLINLANVQSTECPLSLATEKLREIKKLEPRITRATLRPLLAKLEARLVPPERTEFDANAIPETFLDDGSRSELLQELEGIAAKSHQDVIAIANGSEIVLLNGPPDSGLLTLNSTDDEFLKVISTDHRFDNSSVKTQLLSAAQQFSIRGVEQRHKGNLRLAYGYYRVALMIAARYHQLEGLKAIAGSLITLRRILLRVKELTLSKQLTVKEREAALLLKWVAWDANSILSILPRSQEDGINSLEADRVRYRLTILTGNYQFVQHQSMILHCAATEAGFRSLAFESLLFGLTETQLPTILGVSEPPEDLARFDQIWKTYIRTRLELNESEMTTDMYKAYSEAIDHFAYVRSRSVSAGGPTGHHWSFRVSKFLQPLSRDRVQILARHGSAIDSLMAAESTLSRALSDWIARSHRSNRLVMPPGRVGSVGETATATITDVLDSAKKLNADLLYFLKIPAGYGVWLVTREGEIIAEIVNDSMERFKDVMGALPYSSSLREILSENPRGTRAVFKKGSQERIDAALERLYSSLIPSSIASVLELHANRRLIVIPDSTLNYVPFLALRKGNRYLIEDREVMTLPSITAWLLIKSETRVRTLLGGRSESEIKTTPSMVIGNPVFPEDLQLQALPGTEREARAVAKILGVAPKINSMATISAALIKGHGSRVIHIATHGVLIPERPFESFLAMTDGILTTRTLYEMDRPLRANLVVLSACETALGQIHPDSIVGLSNGFLVAGANAVISSLWLVPDSATSQLMTKFYENLKAGNNSSASLRKAQLALLNEPGMHHPYWWAAFLLNGDPLNPLR